MSMRLLVFCAILIGLIVPACSTGPRGEMGSERPGSEGPDPALARAAPDLEDEGPASPPPREPAPKKALGEASSPAASERKGAPRKPSGKAEVSKLLRDLEDPDRAEAAFRRMWEIPKPLIPELINEVENKTLSKLERIQILVTDPDYVGDSKQFLANRLHGMGKMEEVEEVAPGDLRVVSQEYTKMSYAITRNKKHYKVVMEKFGGFPIGVVVRAGLMTRFRSNRHPARTDDDPAPGKLIEWWREFYRRAGPDLDS